ncbi:MAG TPA: hypothetical protein VM901_05415 [Bdellovibrionota bacterium]|jgi:hypothetical protein|nr:hypothetical protein [Bdellovibrionota bacterium]
MRAISWMTFIFVVAFAMYFRSIESFSGANRDQITLLERHQAGIERSLSSTDEKNVKRWKELQEAIEPQPSIQDFQ